MQLINTKHKDIIPANAVPLAITIEDEAVHFTATAAAAFGIEAGKYMHFVNPQFKKWYFLVNNDPDGFKIQPKKNGNKKGVIINSSPLARLMRKDLRLTEPTVRYYLQPASIDYNGTPMIEILTSKALSEIGHELKAA